jgi:hypothetical protein
MEMRRSRTRMGVLGAMRDRSRFSCQILMRAVKFI